MMGKFKNGLLVTVSGAFAVGSLLLGTTYYNSNVKGEEVSKDKVKVIKTSETKDKSKVAVELENLFFNSKKVFLAKDISIEAIEELEKKSDDFSSDEKSLLKKVKQKWEVQNSLNGMFETPVMTGDKYIEDATVKEGVTPEKIEKVNKKIEKLDEDDFKDRALQVRMFLEGFIGYSIGANDETTETELVKDTETTETESVTETTETESVTETEITETDTVTETQNLEFTDESLEQQNETDEITGSDSEIPSGEGQQLDEEVENNIF